MLEFEEDPLPDHWNRWGLGCGGALLTIATAAAVAPRTTVSISGRRGGLNLQGNDVTALAIILTALAVFLHVHFFWTGTERLAAAREILRVMALAAGLIAFGAILFHQIPIF